MYSQNDENHVQKESGLNIDNKRYWHDSNMKSKA